MWDDSVVICHSYCLAHETQKHFGPFLSQCASSWRPASCGELPMGFFAWFGEDSFLIFENRDELFSLLFITSLLLSSSLVSVSLQH